jgi:subtilisin family serine protease
MFTGAAQAQNGQGRGNGAGASDDVVQLRPAGPVLGQYIVVFEDDVTNPRGLANALARAHGFAPRHVYEVALKGFAARLPAPVAEMLALDPDVAYVEQDVYVQTQLHGNNYQTLTEGVDRIDADLNATANIDYVDDRVDVDIAIIDTGIDLDHPELNVVFNRNFNNSSKSGDDDNGHGTHVAGSAAALDNNRGVVGVAPGARLWALKVLDRRGSGSFADVIAGIDFVTANAAEIEVANMSLGGTGRLDSLRTAIQNSVAAGVVYVVAAGNSSRDVYGNDGIFEGSKNDDFIPAAYPEVAAISAMGDTDGFSGGIGDNTSYGTGDDTFASFTNFSRSVVAGNPVTSSGAAIDLAAPGVDIMSTYKDGMYAQMSGTSMASPHVAGAAALYIAANVRAYDAAGVAAIRQALINMAEPQSEWRPASTNDPDSNQEGLVYAGDGGEIAPPNDAPVATITSPADGFSVASGVPISFAGSASDTEDEDLTASLAWTSSIDGSIGSGGNFSTALSDGDHTITASVTDSGSLTGSAAINVTVAPPNDAPVVAITGPTDGSTFGSGAVVSFAGTAGDTEDGDIATTLVWSSDIDGGIGAGGSFSTTLSDGNHTITASATDTGGKTDSASVSITVGDPPVAANTVSVTSVSYATVGGRNGNKHLLITVALEDDLNDPVVGASVSIKLTRTDGGEWNGTGATDEFGEVTFSLKNAKSDCYSTEVMNVTADGLTWDSIKPANEFCK